MMPFLFDPPYPIPNSSVSRGKKFCNEYECQGAEARPIHMPVLVWK